MPFVPPVAVAIGERQVPNGATLCEPSASRVARDAADTIQQAVLKH